ncbi:MAG: TonB-dependent receptor [Pyrinomonadaceae bacterium]
MKFRLRHVTLPLLFLFFSSAMMAQTGSISGNVRSAIGGELIPGSIIELKQAKRTATTNSDGHYEFQDVPNGTYTLIVHSDGFADQVASVVVNGVTERDFSLSLGSINAEVVVSASGDEESVYETFSSVNSVGSTRIAERASTGIGEVLEIEPGVSKRSFGGPGSSRPSIRGFEGDRVMVLQDGVRNGSVAAASGDHGEPISSFNLERIEVIKGPATLLYGSNAVGGVVNTISDDSDKQHKGFGGYVTGLTGSVNKQYGGAGGASYGIGDFLFKGDFNVVREGDFKTPLGTIPNSASRVDGGTGGIGLFKKNWFVRANVNIDRRRYGIPYAPLYESGELLNLTNGVDCTDPLNDCQYDVYKIKGLYVDQLPPTPDEATDISMRRNNYRVWGGFNDLDSPITDGNFTADYTDYEHSEIEIEDGNDSIATQFFNDLYSYRATFKQRKFGSLQGQFGVEGYHRSYLIEGEEKLIDGRVHQNNYSVFGLQELTFNNVALQFGARVESNKYNPDNPDLVDKSFTGLSAAVGARFGLWTGGTLIANFSTSFRAPALEELYNDGAHAGTVTYEIGSSNLERERTNGFEISLRQNSNRIRLKAGAFYNRISNFIYLAPEDADNNGAIDIEDLLPIGLYSQHDAEFYGADGSFEFDFNDNVGSFVVADFVHAKLLNSDIYLPRITPARLRFGLDLKKGGLSVRPEIMAVGSRSEGTIFPLETPTNGYNLVNVNAVYAFTSKRIAHIFTFGAENLGNRLYRNHVNFEKDLVPERGRGVKFSYSLRFF